MRDAKKKSARRVYMRIETNYYVDYIIVHIHVSTGVCLVFASCGGARFSNVSRIFYAADAIFFPNFFPSSRVKRSKSATK